MTSNHDLMTLPLPIRRAWVAFGIWLRVVVLGIGAMATAVGTLIERNGASAKALLMLAAGSALAAFAWYRASSALRRVTYATASTERRGAREPVAASDRPVVAT
jgi:hypothetical protein